MKLTALEIKGFKSFAEKTVLEFGHGVTAIAGPNGCGKSNIVDAIRWVLGEQSTRSLRSDKMENVIFNGTRHRKPGYLAEVSLSFDNSDKILPTEYSEITITRKLYRSGESEYRLNDISCRLKDITDLFLDTGIGADSYSIIELRMVEELISNKEGSRRVLFEEAAGIAKYKLRKKQTYSKLKDSQEDLERVEDLLFEINKNLKSLEQQARRTEKYYKLKDQYKEISLELASWEVFLKKEKYTTLEKSEKLLADELIRIKTQIEIQESKLQQEKLNSLTKEKQLSFQQKSVITFVAELQKKENEWKFKTEKIKNLNTQIEKLKESISGNKIQVESHQNLMKIIKQKVNPKNGKFSELEILLPSINQIINDLDLSQKKLKNQIDEGFSGLNKQRESQYQKEKELDRLWVQKDSNIIEMQRVNLEFTRIEKNIISNEALLKNILEKYSLDEENLENRRRKENQLNFEIKDKEYKISQEKEVIASEQRKLDAYLNEYKLTKSLVENLEGFPESILFLKKKADWLKSNPLLSDVIFCPEDYRIAIENYLEPIMNYFIVQTRREAEKGIDFLRSNSKGRANFFILDEIRIDTETKSPLIKENKYPLGDSSVPAIEVVEVEGKYKKLVEFILNKVILTNNTSTQLCDPENINLVWLEKSGSFCSSNFKLSGGSIGLFEGKRLGRVKNLEILEKTIERIKIQNSILQLVQEKNDLEFKSLKIDLENLRVRDLMNEFTRTEAERNNLVNQNQGLIDQLNQFTTRKSELDVQINSLNSKIIILIAETKKLKQEIASVEINYSASQNNLETLIEKIKGESKNYNEVNLEFHQLKNEIEGLNKDLDLNHDQIKNLEEKKEKQSFELQYLFGEIAIQQFEERGQNVNFIELYEEKKRMEVGLGEMEEIYYSHKNQIQNQEKSILEIRRKKENTEFLLQETKEKRNISNFELKAVEDRITIEFSISPEDWMRILNSNFETVIPERHSFSEKKEQAEKIKLSLNNFGAINPLATQAYGEIRERFNFIQSQKDDLLKAKTSLLETIQEIDDTAQFKFMEAFSAVRENFIRVFRTLFNQEDSCDLILLNPLEPLESEIEILARPKGKRPLTINQLSGGEKTLTATAILFSLYLLKPAPFCIFDEVDAPLDDTNIDKFNSIIREFSNNSQFIVVSHNKKTISCSDIVYGVTMAEIGISKVISVDLRDV